jgi:hypothetical protein
MLELCVVDESTCILWQDTDVGNTMLKIITSFLDIAVNNNLEM